MKEFLKPNFHKFILTIILLVVPYALSLISFTSKFSFGHQLDKVIEVVKFVIVLPGLGALFATYPNDKIPSFIESAPPWILFFGINIFYLYFVSCLVLWIYKKVKNYENI